VPAWARDNGGIRRFEKFFEIKYRRHFVLAGQWNKPVSRDSTIATNSAAGILASALMWNCPMRPARPPQSNALGESAGGLDLKACNRD